MHRLTGAIDAALGPGQDIDRAWRRTAGDAAVGQIEPGARHVEEDVILSRILRGQHCRNHAGRAAHQAGGEDCRAILVRLGRAEDFIVLGKQLQIDAGHRLGAAERTGKHMQPVRAGIGGETDIGDDEPLRRLRIPFLAMAVAGRSGQHIDAGLAGRKRLVDRKTGDHVLVQLAADIDRAVPDEFAAVLLNLVGRITAHLGQELRVGEQRGDIAVADAIELQIRLLGIDRNDRNAAACGGRQHKTVARKTHHRRAVLDVDVEIDLGQQRLIHRRRQAAAQRQLVALAMGQAFDADLIVLGFHRLRRLAVEHDIGRVIDTGLYQRFGKLHADPRIGAVIVDAIVGDAETLAFAQVVIDGLHGAGIGERQACLIGIQRRPPALLFRQCRAENGKRVGAGRSRAGEKVTVDRCKRAFAIGSAVVLGRAGRAGKLDPQGAVLGHHRERALVIVDRYIDIALQKFGLGNGLQRFEAKALLVIGKLQPVLLLARLLQHVFGEEGKLWRSTDIGLDRGGGRHHLAGDGADKAVHLRIVGFQKAPFGLHIIGEGAAGIVTDAGGFALRLGDILDGSEVETGIIAVGGCFYSAVCRLKRRKGY